MSSRLGEGHSRRWLRSFSDKYSDIEYFAGNWYAAIVGDLHANELFRIIMYMNSYKYLIATVLLLVSVLTYAQKKEQSDIVISAHGW